MLYFEEDNPDVLRIKLDHGSNYLDILDCKNPFCSCKNCQLVFLSETEYLNKSAIGIPLALNTYRREISLVEYSLPNSKLKESKQLKTILESKLSLDDWAILFGTVVSRKKELIEDLDISRIPYHYEFSEAQIKNIDWFIGYKDIFPMCNLFKVNNGDGDIEIVDYYCKDVNCDCTKIEFELFKKEIYEGNFIYDFGTNEYDKEYEWVIDHLMLNNANFIERIKLRGLQVKNLFTREIIQRQNELMESNKYLLSNFQKIKVGRNDKCPCGSGKKYKKCCLAN